MEIVIVAAVASLMWSLIALRLGPRLGFVDRPDDPLLKAHAAPAVPLGGVGVFIGLHLAVFVSTGEVDLWLLVATGIVLLLGLVDDRSGLPPVVRLACEGMAGLVLALAVSGGEQSVVWVLLAIGLVVLAVNAVNLFDGLDGLAASVAVVTAFAVVWLGVMRGVTVDAPLALSGAVVGFLVLGWHPAKVFLGDAGAYVIGVVLSYAMLRSAPGEVDLIAASSLLGVFVLDLVVTIVRRLRARRPLFEGDRGHLYDQLRDRGWSIPGVVYLAVIAQAVLTSITLGIEWWLGPLAALSGLVAVGALLLIVLARRGFLESHPV